MTRAEAKDYAFKNLPCTVKNVALWFNRAFNGRVKVHSIIGMTPQALGYTRLVVRLFVPRNAAITSSALLPAEIKHFFKTA
jgi:hypothetical protein